MTSNLANEAATWLGLLVRWTNVASYTGYEAFITNNTAALFRFDAGVATQIGATTSGLTFADKDVWTLQAAGASLTLYQNYKRIVYFYDATYTSGMMGYRQLVNGTSNVANNKVYSFRGYGSVQQDGIWSKKGIVIPAIARDLTQATAGTGIQAWSVFLDTNAQILSGTVYKTWIVSDWTNDAAAAMYYAESNDGISWTRTANPVLASVTNGFVVKNASTYYLYGQNSGQNGSGTMVVYTSSDGVNWNVQSPSQTLAPGGVGAWDHLSFYNLIAVTINGATWHGYYNAANGGNFSTGHATSTDGINWVKDAGNPVITNYLPSNAIVKVGSTWYMWCTHCQPGQGGTVLDPFEMHRFSSTDLVAWTASAKSLHHSQMFESVNTLTGGLTPISIVNSYMYTNSSSNDASPPAVGQIGLAVAPAPAQSIVLFQEDAVAQVASDAFPGADGDLSGNWVTPAGSTKLTVASHKAEASAVSTFCMMAYTGASFTTSQYSEVTLATLSNAGGTPFIGPAVYVATGANSCYFVNMGGAANSAFVTTAIDKRIAGANTAISSNVQITPQINDVFRLAISVGSDGFNVISFYQNGYLILQIQDQLNSLTSGFPGMYALSAVIANAQISLWAGGNIGVNPAFPTASGNAGAVRLRRRKRIYAIS